MLHLWLAIVEDDPSALVSGVVDDCAVVIVVVHGYAHSRPVVVVEVRVD